jgi:tRNA threonylcarbamoyladenosine dehydratase
MANEFSRTELLIGAEGLARLEASTVAVIGLGGVGSWAAEALARAGVGGLVLVDDDSVCATNTNRQLIAARSTIGKPKVEAMRDRVLDINPRIRVEALRATYGAETAGGILLPGLAYVIDAIDSLAAKLDLIARATAAGLPIVSAMGAGNKLDPTRIEVADISETAICPLARAMRKELRKLGIERLKVVYSREPPIEVADSGNPCRGDCQYAGACPGLDASWSAPRPAPGSLSFVTPVFGFVAASVAVRDIVGNVTRPSPCPTSP